MDHAGYADKEHRIRHANRVNRRKIIRKRNLVLLLVSLIGVLDDLILSLLRIFLLVILSLGIWCLYENAAILRDAGPERTIWSYRPDPETGEAPGLDELCRINPDVRGWITIPGTGIDHPILQGEDNVRYVNTNVYGEFSVSGSIFLDSRCSGDFSDKYSLIYGHHMEGGRMFADLERFMDRAYLQEHQEAILTSVQGVSWKARIFACMNADGYDSRWYDPQDTGQEDSAEKIRGILQLADAAVQEYPRTDQGTRILALSTCAEEGTNQRILVFACYRPEDQIKQEVKEDET